MNNENIISSKTSKNTKIKYYFLSLYLIYITDALVFAINRSALFEIISESTLLVVGIICFLRLLRNNDTKKNHSLQILVIASISIIITQIINFDLTLICPIKISALLFGYVLAKEIDKELLIECYIKVMAVISVVSLIGFLFADFIKKISFLPRVYTYKGAELVSLILTNIPTASHSYRNWGPLWEPGAYQAYLMISIFFTMFLYKANYKNKRWLIILFMITLFSTLSTTGLITFPFFILAYLFDRENSKKQLFMKITVLILSIILVAYFISNVDLVNKVFAIKFASDVEVDRIQTIKVGLKVWMQRPIFGYASKYLDIMERIAGYKFSITSTIVSNFVVYGTFIGIYFMYGIKKMIDSIKTNYVSTILLYFGFLLMLSGERFIYSPIFALLMYLRFTPITKTNKIMQKNVKGTGINNGI